MRRQLLPLLCLPLLFGCAGNSSKPNPSSNAPVVPASSTKDDAPGSARFKEGFSFTHFQGAGSEEKETLADGLTLYKRTITKTSGEEVIIHSLEANLSKVKIAAGTKDNASLSYSFTKAVPYQSALDYESATNKAVYASLNADFFGSETVNAFVKDGFIVKAAHNDNGNYDYANSTSDVPASYPRLLGIKGDKAIVSPILEDDGKDPTLAENKEKYIKASLDYFIQNGSNQIETGDDAYFVSAARRISAGCTYVDLNVADGFSSPKVESKETVSSVTKLSAPEKEHVYLVLSDNVKAASFASSLSTGDTLSVNVHSPDGTFDGCETILGCRHSLIEEGEVADTVALESSNGAQNNEVPRSAVGVREDGTFVLYAVESLYYSKRNSTGDPHGLSLTELAEYMSYNNILEGANFDGGGSTQLVVKKGKEDSPKVLVRSSDTGSDSPLSSRAVMNAILICER